MKNTSCGLSRAAAVLWAAVLSGWLLTGYGHTQIASPPDAGKPAGKEGPGTRPPPVVVENEMLRITVDADLGVILGINNRKTNTEYLTQYLRRLVALRQQVKADLYASDFRDEIGLGPLPEKVYAKLFRRQDGQSLTLNLVDRRSGEKAPFELTIDLGQHEFSQPGPATLHAFDSRPTSLAAHADQGKLVMQIPALTGELAAIVIRRAPDSGR